MELPVKSATYAMKGKQLLQAEGIRASVGKRSGENGCYYLLNVADKHVPGRKKNPAENEILK